MLFTDSYFTIDKPATGEYKDRGSRFMAYLYPVKTEDESKELLKLLKKEHHAAAHHCWALVLGADQGFQKSNDDREPGGTAGKPMLRALIAARLTFVFVVVVRYFGGKLLGVPGLIQAYGSAAEAAIGKAVAVEKILYSTFFIACLYGQQHEVIRILKQFSVKFYQGIHTEQEGIIFEVKPSQVNTIEKIVRENGFKMTWVQP